MGPFHFPRFQRWKLASLVFLSWWTNFFMNRFDMPLTIAFAWWNSVWSYDNKISILKYDMFYDSILQILPARSCIHRQLMTLLVSMRSDFVFLYTMSSAFPAFTSFHYDAELIKTALKLNDRLFHLRRYAGVVLLGDNQRCDFPC